ncbi:hypothetical protein B0H66DRAFT_529354 [Apodospora peruviana]|uniref:Uncharacterized protein n=1 Tax=Apodospora peruviana TaxID=516989 RepID=A0AAE0MBU3_9PEZI|nr:hypothetical protein B0H66DRAFT_529354 [Apodospora peruviana]
MAAWLAVWQGLASVWLVLHPNFAAVRPVTSQKLMGPPESDLPPGSHPLPGGLVGSPGSAPPAAAAASPLSISITSQIRANSHTYFIGTTGVTGERSAGAWLVKSRSWTKERERAASVNRDTFPVPIQAPNSGYV